MNEITITEQFTVVADVALRKSGSAADAMLMEIAEQGDDIALEVVRSLPPSATAAIVREHDYTKPSMLGLLSKPEDVVSLFVNDPKTWGNIYEENVEDFICDIRDVTTSVILSKDDDVWRSEVFDAIAESDSALLYLAVAFSGHVFHDGGESFSFHFRDYGDGTLAHLHREMSAHNQSLTQRVAMIVCGHMDWHYGNEFAILQKIHKRAQNITLKGVEEVQGMFEPL